MTAGLRVRTLTANFRITTVDSDQPEHDWETVRKPLALDLVRVIGATVMFTQEADHSIREDLAAFLGSSWSHQPAANVGVWWNNAKHTLLEWQRYALPSPDVLPDSTDDIRRLVLAKFETSGSVWWGASTHFTKGSAFWQNEQMRACVKILQEAGAIRRVVFGGDFNAAGTSTDTPRGIAQDANLWDMRSNASRHRPVEHAKMNTYNGWQTPVYEGRWIDDILTGADWLQYWGRVVDTGGASDHNWLVMSAETLS